MSSANYYGSTELVVGQPEEALTSFHNPPPPMILKSFVHRDLLFVFGPVEVAVYSIVHDFAQCQAPQNGIYSQVVDVFHLGDYFLLLCKDGEKRLMSYTISNDLDQCEKFDSRITRVRLPCNSSVEDYPFEKTSHQLFFGEWLYLLQFDWDGLRLPHTFSERRHRFKLSNYNLLKFKKSTISPQISPSGEYVLVYKSNLGHISLLQRDESEKENFTTRCGDAELHDHNVRLMMFIEEDVFLIISNKVVIGSRRQLSEHNVSKHHNLYMHEILSSETTFIAAFVINRNNILLTDDTGRALMLHLTEDFTPSFSELGILTIVSDLTKISETRYMASSKTSVSVIFDLATDYKSMNFYGVFGTSGFNSLNKNKIKTLSNTLKKFMYLPHGDVTCYSDAYFTTIRKFGLCMTSFSSEKIDLPPFCVSIQNCHDGMVYLQDINNNHFSYSLQERELHQITESKPGETHDEIGKRFNIKIVVQDQVIMLLEEDILLDKMEIQEPIKNFHIQTDQSVVSILTTTHLYFISNTLDSQGVCSSALKVLCKVPVRKYNGVESMISSISGKLFSVLLIRRGTMELVTIGESENNELELIYINWETESSVIFERPVSSILAMVRTSDNTVIVSTSSKELLLYNRRKDTPVFRTQLPFEILQFLTFKKSESIIGYNPNCSFWIDYYKAYDYALLVTKLPFTANTTSIKSQCSGQLVGLSDSKLNIMNFRASYKNKSLHIQGEIKLLKFVKGLTTDYLICSNSNKLMLIESFSFSLVDEMEMKHIKQLEIIDLPNPDRMDKLDSHFGILVSAIDESDVTPIGKSKEHTLCVIGINQAGKFVELSSKVTSESTFPELVITNKGEIILFQQSEISSLELNESQKGYQFDISLIQGDAVGRVCYLVPEGDDSILGITEGDFTRFIRSVDSFDYMDDEGAPFDFDTLQVGNSELLVQIHPNFYAIAEKKKLSIVTFVSNEEKESTTPKQLTTVNFESRIKNILVPEDHDKQDVDYKAKDVGCYVILEGSEPWFIPLEKKKEDDDEFLF